MDIFSAVCGLCIGAMVTLCVLSFIDSPFYRAACRHLEMSKDLLDEQKRLFAELNKHHQDCDGTGRCSAVPIKNTSPEIVRRPKIGDRVLRTLPEDRIYEVISIEGDWLCAKASDGCSITCIIESEYWKFAEAESRTISTSGPHVGPTEPPPQVVVVHSGPPDRSAAEILYRPTEPNFLPLEKK